MSGPRLAQAVIAQCLATSGTFRPQEAHPSLSIEHLKRCRGLPEPDSRGSPETATLKNEVANGHSTLIERT
jgi:hypothetical protein